MNVSSVVSVSTNSTIIHVVLITMKCEVDEGVYTGVTGGWNP